MFCKNGAGYLKCVLLINILNKKEDTKANKKEDKKEDKKENSDIEKEDS